MVLAICLMDEGAHFAEGKWNERCPQKRYVLGMPWKIKGVEFICAIQKAQIFIENKAWKRFGLKSF